MLCGVADVALVGTGLGGGGKRGHKLVSLMYYFTSLRVGIYKRSRGWMN